MTKRILGIWLGYLDEQYLKWLLKKLLKEDRGYSQKKEQYVPFRKKKMTKEAK